MNIHLIFLTLCQGLFLTNNVTFIAINGLVGLSLAPYGWMATLPMMGYVIGGAAFAGLVGRLHTRLGRRRSFMLGALVAIISALICLLAAMEKNFALLVLGTFIAGFYQANGQLYRFAAAEISPAAQKEKAVSWVLAGGLIGAIAGPNIANLTKNSFGPAFAGSYLALVIVGGIALLLISRIRFPNQATAAAKANAPDQTGLLRRPVFIVCMLIAALSYGVMNLLMAATPLAMEMCTYPFKDTALVLEWHVIGMFAPGFFTGHLIKRFGAIPIMVAGIGLYVICIAVALSGQDLHQFLIALFLLGVGWNFLFTASTTLSLSSYGPAERDKAQALTNTAIFLVMAASAFSSGALVTTQGWHWLNLGSLAPTLVMIGALLWFVLGRKKTDTPA